LETQTTQGGKGSRRAILVVNYASTSLKIGILYKQTYYVEDIQHSAMKKKKSGSLSLTPDGRKCCFLSYIFVSVLGKYPGLVKVYSIVWRPPLEGLNVAEEEAR